MAATRSSWPCSASCWPSARWRGCGCATSRPARSAVWRAVFLVALVVVGFRAQAREFAALAIALDGAPGPHLAWSTGRTLTHLGSEWHDRAGLRQVAGYPKAALFGFCVALVLYNAIALLRAALSCFHPVAPAAWRFALGAAQPAAGRCGRVRRAAATTSP